MLRQSDTVLVPLGYARSEYDRHFSRYNPNVFTFSLLFDDECKERAPYAAEEAHQYFSFLGNVHKAHDFDAFVRFAKYAIKTKSAIRFDIATKTNLCQPARSRPGVARTTPQRGEGQNTARQSALERRDEPALPRELLRLECLQLLHAERRAGPRVHGRVAGHCQKNGQLFPEYVVSGVNGEFVHDSRDFEAILRAAERIRQNIQAYAAGCRATFMKTFYYAANRDQPCSHSRQR